MGFWWGREVGSGGEGGGLHFCGGERVFFEGRFKGVSSGWGVRIGECMYM